MTTSRRDRFALSLWAYRLLLRLYPRWFRELYGVRMQQDFADLLSAKAARRPLLGRVACWSLVVRDLLVSIPGQRQRAARPGGGDNHSIDSEAMSRGTMSSLIQDVRYALRTLTRCPGFTVTVVLTLALGIGANIAMFSVISGVLLHPLPYESPEQLVMVWNRHANTGADKVQISGPDFLDYREQATLFDDFAAIHNSFDNTLGGGTEAEPINVAIVSSNFFSFLGRNAIVGRGFLKEDEDRIPMSAPPPGELSPPAPVVISHGLWARRYGQRADIVGQLVYVNDSPMEVIGVMPADFKLVLPDHDGGMVGGGAFDVVDVWRTFPEQWFDGGRSMGMFRVVGRMKEDVTAAQAQAEIDGVAARLREEFTSHEERGTQVDLYPMHADVVGKIKPVVLSLFGAVGFILLIACANVANLLLVRASQRRREITVRAALGASRRRIVRQLLTENAMLAVAGTGLGLALAFGAVDLIVKLAPSNVPRVDEIGVDATVMFFAVGVTLIAVLLFGLVPAIRSVSPRITAGLNDGNRSSTRRGMRLKTGIVVTEIALSLVLLVGGGLMFRSFLYLQGAQLGFEPTRALTANISLTGAAYRGGDRREKRAAHLNALRREVATVAGVEAVGLVLPLPFAGRGRDLPYGASGTDSDEWGRNVATLVSASPGYFEAMGARLVSGRTFTDADIDQGRDVVVVDDLVAARLFAGENPVGRSIWMQNPGAPDRVASEIVGVVSHIRHESVVGVERETIFFPLVSSSGAAMVVRANGDPWMLLGGVEDAVRRVTTNVPLSDVRTFDDYIGDQIAPTRFTMTLAGVFALLALVLASVGLYGVIAFSVAQRATELGIRVALGAQQQNVMRLVMGHGLAMSATGIGIGIATSLGLTRAIRGLLYGVTPTDPVTLVGVAALLGVVALVASYVPARRAASIDPMRVLRAE